MPSMVFQDREEAGEKLAEELLHRGIDGDWCVAEGIEEEEARRYMRN